MKLNKKLAVAGAALAALISTAVIAGPIGYFEERIYYSDATYTQVVGDGSLTCMGNVYVDGQETNYYVVIHRSRCFGGGGGL